MKAALYGRYSTDKQREASIEDQFRNCKRHAEHEGWLIMARYKDGAVSGATADRPNYQAMLADAQAGAFDLLLVDDLSRLSRDDVELKQTVRRFRYWGSRIVGVSDGFDSDSKGYKIHAGVRGLINEIYLDDLREKTHRGLTGQALNGFNTGGRCYGYRHIPIEDGTRKDEYGRPAITAVKREIDADQAKWVRQIFEWYADGHTPRWIAAELNRQGVKSARGGTWADSAIYGKMRTGTGLLNNELYVGRYVWNRSNWLKDPDTGKKKRIPRPKDEWVVKDMPELRIVPQALWDRVKARQKEQAEKSKAVRAALHKDKARTGAGPKYLFSSLLKCGVCGASYAIADAYRYGCSTNINRGDAACPNDIKVPRKLVEERLLEGIKRDLFTPEGIDLFKREVTRLLAERKAGRNADGERAKRDLAKVEQEIANIIKAIRKGIITASTKAELEKAEAEKDQLERTLKVDANGLDKIEDLLPRTVDRYREMVEHLETTVQRHVSKARNHIKALVGGEIKLIPMEDGYLEAELAGDYAGLVKLASESPGSRGPGASQLSLVAGARNRFYLLFVAPGIPKLA